MSLKLPPEPTQDINYSLWRKDVIVWTKLTDTARANRGRALQYACRNNKRLHEAVLDIEDNQVDCEEGLENVLKVLDNLHNIDKTQSALDCYLEFDSLKRKENQKVSDFINEFEALANKTKKNGNTLTDDLLTYKLLRASNLTKTEERIIKASTEEFKFENIKKTILRYFADSTGIKEEKEIKPEPIYHTGAEGGDSHEGPEGHQYLNTTPEDETFYASNKWRNKQQYQNNRPNTNQARYQNGRSEHNPTLPTKGRNPLDRFGNITHCSICCSINHWKVDCPDKHLVENFHSSALHHVTLFEEDEEDPSNIGSLVRETINCAVLDCGAARTVCGENWLDIYLSTLSEKDKDQVTYTDSTSVFKFGSGSKVKSLCIATIPITLGSKQIKLKTDVVKKDLPLLLSKRSMKLAETHLDTKNDIVFMLGEEIPLITTSTDHYAVPISQNRTVLEVEKVKVVLFSSKPNMSRQEIALKLHKQFAHPPAERLLKLLSNSEYGSDLELIQEIKEVSEKCDTCKKYKRTPSRPVVGMPMATKFNQTVAMDIKYMKGKPVLHMIDALTRFSACVVVPSKQPKCIVDVVFKHWISIFGPPGKILSDNGGEFANEEIRSMGEAFNMTIVTTAAESPWANGICEKYNGVIGEMVDKILEEVDCTLTVAVAWANAAKNSLQNIHGFSPAQLVFGFTPMLPTVQTDKPPALSEFSYSQLVEENLQAMRQARAAHIQAESSARIRRALSHNLRSSGDIKYTTGDRVYYKRVDDKKWHSPGTVIGQDGQFVLVKTQISFVRVHPCRLQLVGPPSDLEQIPATVVNQDKQQSNIEEDLTQSNEVLDTDSELDESDPNESLGNNAPVNGPDVAPENENDLDETTENNEVQDINDNNENADQTTQNELEEKDDQKTPQSDSNENEYSDLKAMLKELSIGKTVVFTSKTGDEVTGKILSRAGKAGGRYKNAWNMEVGVDQTCIDFDRDVSNIISVKNISTETSEPIVNNIELNSEDEILCCQVFNTHLDQQITKAKNKELSQWLDKAVYTETEYQGQKLVGLKWVIKPKIIDGVPDMKARLVAKGFQESDDFRRDSPTCSKASIRVVLTIIPTMNWQLQSIDIKGAFLQSDEIDRDVFVKPPKEAQTTLVWHLRKPIYGLKDASRRWYKKIQGELITLGCKPTRADLALFYWWSGEKLQGILALFVDDLLYGGSEIFEKQVINQLQGRLVVGSKQNQAFKYLGVNLTQEIDGSILLDQNSYIASMKEVPGISSHSKHYSPSKNLDEELTTQMRSAVGQLNWLSSMSRPDLAFHACQMSTIINSATERDIVKLNKVIKDIKSSPITVWFPKLSLDLGLELHVYTDAAYANLHDGASQGGYIVFLTDGIRSSPLDWLSHRLKRVARSTLTAEVQALLDGVDAAIYYSDMIFQVTGIRPQITCYSDNNSLVECSKTSHVVEEKRLRIELLAIRECVDNGEIKLKWVSTKNQLADALTKEGVATGCLKQVLVEGALSSNN